MSAVKESPEHIDVAPLVIQAAGNVRSTLHRSPLWKRMEDGSLPFAGRASYLEQHWEGPVSYTHLTLPTICSV